MGRDSEDCPPASGATGRKRAQDSPLPAGNSAPSQEAGYPCHPLPASAPALPEGVECSGKTAGGLRQRRVCKQPAANFPGCAEPAGKRNPKGRNTMNTPANSLMIGRDMNTQTREPVRIEYDGLTSHMHILATTGS